MPPLLGRILDRLRKATPATTAKSAGPYRLDDHGLAAALSMSTRSGVTVSDFSAMQLSTAWACIRLTSEAVASLPVHLYERDANGGRRTIDHPLAEVLDSPNEEMTSFDFWQAMAAWLCTRGNAYAEIARSGERIVALNVLPADRIHVMRDQNSGDLRYCFTDRGKPVDLSADNVLHIRGFGFGGDLGLSPIQYAAQTLGAAQATEEAASSFFANGIMTSGVFELDGEIPEQSRQRLAEQLKAYAGSRRAGKFMVLEGGLKYRAISLDPESTQMLETRRFSVEEIARWFGIPPIIVGHAAEGQTMWGTGVEAIVLQWLTTGLNPFLTRIERRIRKQLIPPGDRRRVYAEFNREALLQADTAGKASFLSTMVQNGLMSRSEGRAKLNLPSRAGADALTAQTNLAPLDRLGGSGDAAVKSAFRSWLGLEDSNAENS